MQPLEFEFRAYGRQFQDGRDAVRIVGGELRQDHVRMAEQAARARQVGHVGRGLARVHRIAVESSLLTTLDLAVPVSALHQSSRHPAAVYPRERRHPVDDVQSPLAVPLDGQSQARPVPRRSIARQRLDDIQ